MRASLFTLVVPFAVLTAQQPDPARSLAKLPVKEVTIFKDGHAFIVHQGRLPTDGSGNAVLDQLPTPLLGTFWPFTTEPSAKLVASVAGRHLVRTDRTTSTLADLVAANVGAEVTIAADSSGPVRGTLLSIGDPTGADTVNRAVSEIVMLATPSGVRALRVSRVGDILFKNPPRQALPHTEFKNRLTLKFDWAGTTGSTVSVGLGYVEKGLQWVPSYRIVLDGKGGATVSLQATLVNDVVDLENVTANLVIGVPSFRFRGMTDPMALQETLALPGEYDQEGRRLSNLALGGLRGQLADYRSFDRRDESEQPADLDGARHEDLFVFTVPKLTLKKGERMTLPVAQYQVKYSDLFALTIYHTPPQEIGLNNQSPEQLELVRMMNRPTVMHKIRIKNTTTNPFTTAPALIVRGDQVLAQGMMTYTPMGASADLDITQAVDIRIEKQETEVRRTPAAARWQGNDYARVDLTGDLTLTNHRDVPVEVEVTRYLLGAVDMATAGGTTARINVLEDEAYLPPRFAQWWNWYNWPHWWTRLNGIGKVQWTVQLQPNVAKKLGYRWHYFWEP